MKAKRKVTIKLGNALYNVSKAEFTKLAMHGMTHDGITEAELTKLGATKVTPPSPDVEVTSWKAKEWQARMLALISGE